MPKEKQQIKSRSSFLSGQDHETLFAFSQQFIKGSLVSGKILGLVAISDDLNFFNNIISPNGIHHILPGNHMAENCVFVVQILISNFKKIPVNPSKFFAEKQYCYCH
jgi:hypothetical protein